MDKQTITRDIKKEIGNWVNISQIAKYLGKSRNTVAEMMRGVDGYRDKKCTWYLANDVAQRIMEQR